MSAKPATRTAVERRNERMHKIFEDARIRKELAAYPRLVAALRARVEYEDARPPIHSYERQLWDNERALLRELGEL